MYYEIFSGLKPGKMYRIINQVLVCPIIFNPQIPVGGFLIDEGAILFYLNQANNYLYFLLGEEVVKIHAYKWEVNFKVVQEE
jgi:hypothetical protein